MASPEGVAARTEEDLERTRLLYVGLTRARDHLALATTGAALTWLDGLRDDVGSPLVRDGGDVIRVGDGTWSSRRAPDVGTPVEDAEAPPPEYTRPVVVPVAHPALRIRPSARVLDGPVVVVANHLLGSRVPLVGNPDLRLVGEVVHRFLAADDPGHDAPLRLAHATAALDRWGVPQVAPAHLVEISDRFVAFLSSTYGRAAARREWPLHVEEGLQTVSGRIDLLVDLGDAYAIVDHKSFPGSLALDEERLGKLAGQVDLYARAVAGITGRTRFEFWVHQPIAAVMTRIQLPRR